MSQDFAEKIDLVVPKEYGIFLGEIKEKMLSSQVKAALADNRELIALYWDIGAKIHLKQKREGRAVTNFQLTLPSPQSDLAHQTLKDSYCFDFLTLRDKHDEQEFESGLLDHV